MSPVPARNRPQGKALTLEEVLFQVQANALDASIESYPNGSRWIRVSAQHWPSVAKLLHSDPSLRFDSLCCLSGLDLQRFPGAEKGVFPSDELVVVADLHSLVHRHSARIKVFVPRTNPVIPSVESVWGVAGYFEREIWDLYGVVFEGNHNLKRIMTPQDWVGHPLRKDYQYPQAYNGVELKREGQAFETGPYR